MTTFAGDQATATRVLRQRLYGFIDTALLYTATYLGIPDLLATGHCTCDDFSVSLSMPIDRVQQLLRGLHACDIVTRDDVHRYRLTDQGELLCRNTPNSCIDEVLYAGNEMYRAFGALAQAGQSASAPFTLATGTPFFTYLQQHPEEARAFGRYIAALSTSLAQNFVAAYGFANSSHIVDVGGGIGVIATTIVATYPHLTAEVLDQEAVQATAQQFIATQHMADRCHFVAGNFFTAIPRGDTLILSQILHDFADGEAQRILQCCRAAITETGRLLILEMLIDETHPTHALAQRDVKMWAMTNGRERTVAGYQSLLDGAHFTLMHVTALPSHEQAVNPTGFAILEAHPC